jgi:hypothetical protein
LSSPYRETPQTPKRNKKNDKGQGNKNRRTALAKTFAIVFLSSPYREALNRRNKKNRKRKKLKNPPRKNIPPPPKNISPWILLKRTRKQIFELPLPRNAQKRTNKIIKKKKVRTFFCELAQMHVVFPFFFSAAP